MNTNIERPIVAKFGGFSMADVASIKNVAEIVNSDPSRRFIVVSAPGRNHAFSEKITDILVSAYSGTKRIDRSNATNEFSRRFSLMGRDLGVDHVGEWIGEVLDGIGERREKIPSEFGLAWCKSRGEWLMARIFAYSISATFMDAQDLIRIKNGGQIDPTSYDLVGKRLAGESGLVVIPGFYGLDELGQVQTFDRGGSDVTGAIIARGVNARVYENWTNVDGVLSANPNIVSNPRVLRHITYEEIRELGIRGVEVLQRDTILPLAEKGIPINLRNTFNPEDLGTMIESERQVEEGEDVIAIADGGPFTSSHIQKYGMNEETGIGGSILDVFSSLGISYEQDPSGKDYMSVIVDQAQLNGGESAIISYLKTQVNPDEIRMRRNLGLLSLVGHGVADNVTNISGRLFSSLDRASIPVRAISFGTSGISVVVAVDNDRLEDAVRLSHEIFIENK